MDGSEVWPGAEQGEGDLAGAEVVQAGGAERDLVGGVPRRAARRWCRGSDRSAGAWVFQVRVVSDQPLSATWTVRSLHGARRA